MKFTLSRVQTMAFMAILFINLQLAASSEWSYLAKSIAEPYLNLIHTYQEQIRETADQLRNFFGHSSTQLEEPSQKPLTFPSKDQTYMDILDEEYDNYDDNESREGRMLQTSCGRGVSVTATRTTFNCYGGQVTTEEYYNNNGPTNPNCQATTRTITNACYCPFDFYGRRCENFNAPVAEITQLTYKNDCGGPNDNSYINEYGGVPPCNKVNVGDTLTLEFLISLRPSEPRWAYEGVKYTWWEITQQPQKPKDFTYVVETPTLKLSLIPENTRLHVAFIDFKQSTIPTNFSSSPITVEQAVGNQTITIPVTITEELKEQATAGRYYYEAVLLTDMSDLTANPILGAFDDASFKEPPPTKERNHTTLIVVLFVLGALLVIAAYAYWVHLKKVKENLLKQRLNVEEISDEVR